MESLLAGDELANDSGTVKFFRVVSTTLKKPPEDLRGRLKIEAAQ